MLPTCFVGAPSAPGSSHGQQETTHEVVYCTRNCQPVPQSHSKRKGFHFTHVGRAQWPTVKYHIYIRVVVEAAVESSTTFPS